jgi:hypothetical protein
MLTRLSSRMLCCWLTPYNAFQRCAEAEHHGFEAQRGSTVLVAFALCGEMPSLRSVCWVMGIVHYRCPLELMCESLRWKEGRSLEAGKLCWCRLSCPRVICRQTLPTCHHLHSSVAQMTAKIEYEESNITQCICCSEPIYQAWHCNVQGGVGHCAKEAIIDLLRSALHSMHAQGMQGCSTRVVCSLPYECHPLLISAFIHLHRITT